MRVALRRLLLPVLVLLLAGAAVLTGIPADADRAALPRADTIVTVGAPAAVAPVAPGFVGLSLEFQALGYYTGPRGPDPALEQLIRNLSPGRPPVLRIGGDSTDHSWWPVGGVPVVPALSYAVGPAWASGVRRLVGDLQARVILGINLEADSPRLAGVEARRLLAAIGRNHVESLELGNEPSLYAVLPWWVSPSGQRVLGRPSGYSPAGYVHDLVRFVPALPRLPLAAPALGDLKWMRSLPAILRASSRVRDVTFHRYPLNRCFTHPGQPTYPTLANLLSPAASRGLAASIAGFAALSRRHHDAFRVDEMNSVACEGKLGLSNTFASALWAADALFAMASRGVAGVNIHTFPGARYRLFGLTYAGGRWSATVAPEYYGLLMFIRAAPAGSRLLRVRVAAVAEAGRAAPPDGAARGRTARTARAGGFSPAVSRALARSLAGSGLRVWATEGGRGPRATRVLLINESPWRRRVVEVLLPGPGGRLPSPTARATLQRLTAPGLTATAGIVLGGQSFPDGTTTGTLAGRPEAMAAPTAGGGYRVTVPAAGAVLLSIPAPSRARNGSNA